MALTFHEHTEKKTAGGPLSTKIVLFWVEIRLHFYTFVCGSSGFDRLHAPFEEKKASYVAVVWVPGILLVLHFSVKKEKHKHRLLISIHVIFNVGRMILINNNTWSKFVIERSWAYTNLAIPGLRSYKYVICIMIVDNRANIHTHKTFIYNIWPFWTRLYDRIANINKHLEK